MRTLAILCLLVAPAVVFGQKSKLPDGPGKDTTQRVCGVCHSVEVSVSARESREGWNSIVLNMIERGAKGSDDEFGEVVDYLTTHYPPGAAGGKCNINTATAKEVEDALDITAEQAAAIVKYREEKGKFKGFEDLSKVPGFPVAKVTPKKALLTF